MASVVPYPSLQFQLLGLDEKVRQGPTLVPDPPPVESVAAEAVKRLRAGLEASIAARLTSGSELVRSLERRRREESLPTAIAAIDTLLGGGLARGKVTEMAGRGLRFSVVIASLPAATSIGDPPPPIHPPNHFPPQLAPPAPLH